MTDNTLKEPVPSILVVDADIISRHVIADYLRNCSYAVVEAATIDEAFVALREPTLSIDVILCDVSTLGSKNGFELASWVRSSRSELEVRLVGGAEMAAETAAELCESGPQLRRPYDPEAISSYIDRLRASRLQKPSAGG